jgi:hypothetical protein
MPVSRDRGTYGAGVRRRRWFSSAVLVLAVSACGGGDDPTPVFGAQIEPDGVTLTLYLESCNTTEQTAEVVETDTDVRVTVHTKGDTRDECADSMQVELTERLGDRPLIDDPTDTEIEVERSGT